MNIKKIPQKHFSKKNIEENNLIFIMGNSGIGKSIFSALIAKYYEKNKILLIDFDNINNSLCTLYGIKKKEKEEIININKKIKLIYNIEIFLDNNKKFDKNKFNKMIEKFKINHKIIIDSNTNNYELIKSIIKNNEIIFITEANLIELNKSKKILKKIIYNFLIERNKIKILINKYNKNSIDKNIIKNIFSDFNIIGKLDYSDQINLFINKESNPHHAQLICTSHQPLLVSGNFRRDQVWVTSKDNYGKSTLHRFNECKTSRAKVNLVNRPLEGAFGCNPDIFFQINI